jgi:hypothetical protein
MTSKGASKKEGAVSVLASNQITGTGEPGVRETSSTGTILETATEN